MDIMEFQEFLFKDFFYVVRQTLFPLVENFWDTLYIYIKIFLCIKEQYALFRTVFLCNLRKIFKINQSSTFFHYLKDSMTLSEYEVRMASLRNSLKFHSHNKLKRQITKRTLCGSLENLMRRHYVVKSNGIAFYNSEVYWTKSI